MHLGGWLGEMVLFGQNELTAFGDAQNVLFSLVHDDDLAGPLHEVNGFDPLPLGA
jgi:hypothetical protein